MAITHFQESAVETSGSLPQVGQALPPFLLVDADLTDFDAERFAGKKIILNIFPSIDTGVCAQSVRHFNKEAADLADTVVICASADLPFAHSRFCAAEGLDNVITGSSFRSSFGQDYGVVLEGSPLKGLLARAVIVADEQGTVVHSQLVDEITTEPDYAAALASIK
ncbi:thiol peroxidase [Corynebacterium diphtheriae]|uniref:Thiol peroxidase n=2 Tax=Corynebacterium diphtheriae TaxID=1717 RepID=Q6NGY6_CORDI|nr:thiol peroxidase [Corynebacterium diphtheriae]AEX76758.1 thiol peroxidase [Corynebacterium diphtheriae HC02]AEX81263.1 thiol peroxidase [Corynebacterium diphtheriae HC04]ARB87508.1 thiol peroxidase [Corynebacterium diphtheriae]EIK56119.1 thiol peroxidase [Corynebacterium diphtheriae bv. intermedius str. NCTC 5011]KKA81024.1 thiol peroxidase [Corynebacterium diphtheriae]